MKKRIAIIVGIISVLILSFVLFFNNNKTVDAIGYEIIDNTYMDVVSSVGIVEYEKEVIVKTEVSGLLLEVNKDVGDRVNTAELIAKIDNNEAILAYDEIKTNSFLSKARYDDYLTTYRKNEEAISDQKIIQENEIASVNLEQLQLNTKILETKTLVDEGVLPAKDLSSLIEQMDKLNLRIQSANTKLKTLRDPLFADKEFKASMDVANQSMAKQELELTKYFIKAPIDGVVIERLVEAGTFTQAGEVIMKIASDAEKYAVVEIDEKYISKVIIGKEAKILIQAYPDEIVKGIVEIISPEVNKETGTIKVKVKILEKQDLFLQNMAVKVEFISESYDNVIVIPGNYIIEGENSSVFIEGVNGEAIKKEIGIYNKNSANIMVLEGLNIGDVILNPENLEEGIKVKVSFPEEGDMGL